MYTQTLAASSGKVKESLANRPGKVRRSHRKQYGKCEEWTANRPETT